MKLTYTTPNDRLTFEAEVENPKAAFETLATIQEVFEVERCGLCGSLHIRCDVREFDGNKYYKLLCIECGATLDYGQRKDGAHLFVRRFVGDTRNPLPNQGWYIYQSPDAAPKTRAAPTAAPPAANGTPPPAARREAPAPDAATLDRHDKILAAFGAAPSRAKLEELAIRAHQYQFPDALIQKQADVYEERMAQLVASGGAK